MSVVVSEDAPDLLSFEQFELLRRQVEAEYRRARRRAIIKLKPWRSAVPKVAFEALKRAVVTEQVATWKQSNGVAYARVVEAILGQLCDDKQADLFDADAEAEGRLRELS